MREILIIIINTGTGARGQRSPADHPTANCPVLPPDMPVPDRDRASVERSRDEPRTTGAAPVGRAEPIPVEITTVTQNNEAEELQWVFLIL